MLGYLKKIRFQAKAELDRWPPMQEKPPPLVHLLPLYVFSLSSHVCFHIELFDRRPEVLFDKTSSSSVDLHEPGDDSMHQNFVLQSKSNMKQPPALQSYL